MFVFWQNEHKYDKSNFTKFAKRNEIHDREYSAKYYKFGELSPIQQTKYFIVSHYEAKFRDFDFLGYCSDPLPLRSAILFLRSKKFLNEKLYNNCFFFKSGNLPQWP